jgi:hypothetical protein
LKINPRFSKLSGAIKFLREKKPIVSIIPVAVYQLITSVLDSNIWLENLLCRRAEAWNRRQRTCPSGT